MTDQEHKPHLTGGEEANSHLKASLAERLADVRKSLGLSQKEFAREAGMSLATLQNAEFGTNFELPASFYAFLIDQGISFDWFFKNEGEMYRLPSGGINDKDYVSIGRKGLAEEYQELQRSKKLDKMLMWECGLGSAILAVLQPADYGKGMVALLIALLSLAIPWYKHREYVSIIEEAFADRSQNQDNLLAGLAYMRDPDISSTERKLRCELIRKSVNISRQN